MSITTLYERKEPRKRLPQELAELYDGDLSFPEGRDHGPYVIGNFVQTIDGVVSYSIPGRSGGDEISGSSTDDRFVMGLLRSMADAVLVGSGTLNGDPGHVRIPEFIYPGAKDLFADLRKKFNKPPLPLNVILTGSGNVNLNEATFRRDGLSTAIITTEEGFDHLAREHGDALKRTTVRSTGEVGKTTPAAVLKILADEFGVRLLLHEGGPTIFGEFLGVGLIDELFLTLAPQIAGSQARAPRPSLTGKTFFLPETAPWFALESLKCGSDHVLLRYVSKIGHGP
jgi:riboflavin biosynthesis pyrimidine reductase